MNDPIRRVAAAGVAVTLIALVVCDQRIASFQAWWDRHSFTGSVMANLLVVAVTALIVDEVVARRQQRKRGVSVAVLGLIVYGQARRAFGAVNASGEGGSDTLDASEELRTLASMVLTASSALFDDPVARRFLEQVERFAGSMIRVVAQRHEDPVSADAREHLEAGMAQVKTTIEPLMARLPASDRSALEGQPQG
jgi:hypothetical protein